MWKPDDHNITDIFAFLGVCVTQSVFYLLNRRRDQTDNKRLLINQVAVKAALAENTKITKEVNDKLIL